MSLSIIVLALLVVPAGVLLTGCGRNPTPINRMEFESNNGSALITIEYNMATESMIPPDPIRDGFTFAGWFWDNNVWSQPFTILSILDQPLQQDMNLRVYARWTNRNAIVFNANGGVGIMTDQVIAEGTSAYLSANTFTRAGFVFAGWATTSWGSAVHQDEASFNMQANGGTTLFAIWASTTTTITFHRNAGGNETTTQNITIGVNTNLHPNTFERQGHTFQGWATTSTGSVEHLNNATVNIPAGQTLILYAVWQANTNTVTYSFQGATGNNSVLTGIVTFGQSFQLAVPTRDNHDFAGWFSGANGTGIQFTGSNGNSLTAWTGLQDITLYAHWAAHQHEITYNNNLPHPQTLTTTQIATYGTNVSLRGIGEFARDGHTLTGWNTQSNGSGISYALGHSFSPFNRSSGFTLYAVWQANTYVLTLDPNGGTIDANMLVRDTVFGNTFTLPTPTRTGYYRFDGWFYSNTQVTAGTWGFTTDKTLVARWTGQFEISGATITGLTDFGRTFNSLVLPSSVNGTTITTIGNNAFINSTFTCVTLPTSITSIGTSAFRNNTNLASIDLSSVTSIGANAFQGCTSLASVTFSNGLVSIGTSAFEGCTTLNNIVFPASLRTINSRAFFNNSSLTSITFPEGLTTIGSLAFSGTTALTTINFNSINLGNRTGTDHIFHRAGANGTGITLIIGAAVTRIPNHLFNAGSTTNAPRIIALNFANDSVITEIGDSAFASRAIITNTIDFPSSLQIIGTQAFASCTFTTLTIPEGIVTIRTEAFISARFSTLNFNARNMTSSNQSIFRWAGLSESGATINIGPLVERIPASLFHAPGWAVYMRTLNWHADSIVTVIGANAFNSIGNNFTSITVPENIVTIGANAFAGNIGVRTINFNAINVTSTNSGIFRSSVRTAVINIGPEVTRIPANLFNDATGTAMGNPLSMSSINFLGNNVTNIGANAFSNNYRLSSITIPESVTSMGANAFHNTNITTINFNATNLQNTRSWLSGNYQFTSIFGMNTTPTTATTVNIGANVTQIPAFMFAGSSTAHQNITRVNFATDSIVASIGTSAFQHNGNLSNITLPESLIELGNNAFYRCSAITTMALPENLESIGEFALYGISVQQLTIPASVIDLPANAISSSTLNVLNILGEDLTFEVGAFGSSPLTIVFVPAGSVDDFVLRFLMVGIIVEVREAI